MDYVVTRRVLGPKPVIPASEALFNRAVEAKPWLEEVLAAEEKLNLLLEDYAEYEAELLTLALRNSLFAQIVGAELLGQFHTVSRRLLNLLSAGRLYIDHTRHSTSKLFGPDSAEFHRIDSAMAHEYDTQLGYRVMEALRNFVQHRGLPIAQIRHEFWRVEREEAVRWRHNLIPALGPRELEGAGGFKSAVLEELLQLGDFVDLRPFVREYVVGLGRVHEVFRTVCAEHVQDAETVYTMAIELYQATGEDSLAGLAVVKRNDDGTHAAWIPIVPQVIERWKWLVTKNATAVHLQNHFVTAEPKDAMNV